MLRKWQLTTYDQYIAGLIGMAEVDSPQLFSELQSAQFWGGAGSLKDLVMPDDVHEPKAEAIKDDDVFLGTVGAPCRRDGGPRNRRRLHSRVG